MMILRKRADRVAMAAGIGMAVPQAALAAGPMDAGQLQAKVEALQAQLLEMQG